jgi:branched-chain amino acid transport system substrate-binding protein
MKRLATLLACSFLGMCQQAPYKDGRNVPSTFEGPGRDLPEPQDLRDVAIGYYGPADAAHPDGGVLWQGASLAVEEANHEGGYRGKPFRLVAKWSENPWSGGAALITQLAFVDRVWAIVGSIEGAGTHLAEQVVVKALLPLVNPAATDRTIHMAGVPWMFSVVQGDDLHSAVLAAALHGRTITVLSATDHDSRAFSVYFKTACMHGNVKTRLWLEFEPGRPDLSELVASANASNSDVTVLIAGIRDSWRLVKLLRASGYGGLIAGGPLFGRGQFTEQAGDSAEGAIFPWVGEPTPAFQRAFAKRFAGEPDYAAACAYDAVRLVIAAIRKAGLNRARIRDAIAAISPSEGVSGRIQWDEFGQNRRPPLLGVIRAGRPHPR